MQTKGINVIITGATGMVGEGVLHECLNDPGIAAITLLSRRSSGVIHPKIKEVLVPDLAALTGNEVGLDGADACFFCLGTTSIGKSEAEYTRLTHDLTLALAKPLLQLNPDITFCYVSAKGADNSEKGKTMWARVKGRTENDLVKMGFKQLYIFRPFMLTPTKGLQHAHRFYRYISWIFPFGRIVYPAGFCTLKELAVAMINVGCQGYGKMILTPPNMIKVKKSQSSRLLN